MSAVKENLKVVWDLIYLGFYFIYLFFESLYFKFIRPPPKSLDGEIILITGSASGIGREICLRLAKLGPTLVCWDVQKEQNERLVEELIKIGAKAFAYEVDISERLIVVKAAAKVKKDVGNVTIIINNAGILHCHQFLDYSPIEIKISFKVNVLAQFWILQEFLPGMLERDNGHIVTVCSAAGLIGTGNMVLYCATKYAVHGYIEALKDEFRVIPIKPNIKFTTVFPTTVQTPLIKNIQCTTRFPNLVPILTPEIVAEKLIDGLRRNYENVYIPSSVSLAGILVRCLSSKAQAALTDFFGCSVLLPNDKPELKEE